MVDHRDAAVDPLLSAPQRFRAVEVDARTRQPTGLVHELAAASRAAAVDQLLGILRQPAGAARIGPNARIIQLGDRAWLIVAVGETAPAREVAPRLRRAGAKHRKT
ncbi:MAG: hypothetical protein JO023_25220 [Chloroflexi bacterium]|nr:hypothetical protein [Chloroflexota bacterium]